MISVGVTVMGSSGSVEGATGSITVPTKWGTCNLIIRTAGSSGPAAGDGAVVGSMAEGSVAESVMARKTPAIDGDLERLLDERAIRRRLVDYCRGIDRCDAELVASVYHPDATDDHGSFKGLGVEFAAYATDRLREAFATTTHTL